MRTAAGQSIVPTLAAVAIIATVAAGTAALVEYLVQQSKRAQIINRAVVIATELNGALLRKDQYKLGVSPARDQQIADFLNPTAAPGQGFQVFGAQRAIDGSTQTTPIAQIGTTLGFSIDGAPCTGAGCAVYTEVSIRCDDLYNSGCLAAYRVRINQTIGNIPMASIGAPTRPPGAACGAIQGFSCADFTVGLSNDFFIIPSVRSCGSAEILVTGINRATGQVKCLQPPDTSCPAGSIAHAVKAVTDATGTHLTLDCTPLATAVCPDQYVFQSLKVAQLDFGSGWSGDYSGHPAPVGVCRYMWRNDIKWQTPIPYLLTNSTISAGATVCNPLVYTAITTAPCTAGIVSQSPGLCGDNSQPYSGVASGGVIDPNSATGSCWVSISDSCNSSTQAYPTADGICRVHQPYLSNLTVPPQWPN